MVFLCRLGPFEGDCEAGRKNPDPTGEEQGRFFPILTSWGPDWDLESGSGLQWVEVRSVLASAPASQLEPAWVSGMELESVLASVWVLAWVSARPRTEKSG